MEKTFYLVMSEFHADGMDAYEDWYESRAEAEAAVRELRGADRGIREREAAR
jgi:hypothetical protein